MKLFIICLRAPPPHIHPPPFKFFAPLFFFSEMCYVYYTITLLMSSLALVPTNAGMRNGVSLVNGMTRIVHLWRLGVWTQNEYRQKYINWNWIKDKNIKDIWDVPQFLIIFHEFFFPYLQLNLLMPNDADYITGIFLGLVYFGFSL